MSTISDKHAGLENGKIAVSAKELADMLGLSVRTVRRLDCSGKLPRPVRIGGAVRWRVAEINGWLAEGCPGRKKWEAQKGARKNAG